MESALATKACICKTTMRRAGNGYFVCPNCDEVQAVEMTVVKGLPGKRVVTTEDRRFHLAWEARKREIYGS